MKELGLITLMAGVALCALFGARNPEVIDERSAARRTVGLYDQSAGEAWLAYCALQPDLAKDEQACAEATPTLPAEIGEIEAPGARQEAISKHVVAMRDARSDLHLESGKAFATWLMLFEARERAKVELERMTPPSAGARLAAWFGLGGLPFLGGLLLICVGGVLARRAVAAEARAEPKAAEGTGKAQARDFGTMLDELCTEVRELAERLSNEALDSAERDAIKDTVEQLQADKIELMVEARGRVEARLGMAGFAAVFGPFSAGERNLNRVWSALVDEHPPEARSAIVSAEREFGRAAEELAKASGAAG